jgi:hypothetical protein
MPDETTTSTIATPVTTGTVAGAPEPAPIVPPATPQPAPPMDQQATLEAAFMSAKSAFIAQQKTVNTVYKTWLKAKDDMGPAEAAYKKAEAALNNFLNAQP